MLHVDPDAAKTRLGREFDYDRVEDPIDFDYFYSRPSEQGGLGLVGFHDASSNCGNTSRPNHSMVCRIASGGMPSTPAPIVYAL